MNGEQRDVLNQAPVPSPAPVPRGSMDRTQHFQWGELALLWNGNNFGGAHDWLGARWNHLIQFRPGGHDDPDARFLQGLAFAALAFYFTQNRNQEGALLLLDDARRVLPGFPPDYLGVYLAPILEALNELRPHLVGVECEADCPVEPSMFTRFQFEPEPP